MSRFQVTNRGPAIQDEVSASLCTAARKSKTAKRPEVLQHF